MISFSRQPKNTEVKAVNQEHGEEKENVFSSNGHNSKAEEVSSS